MRKRYPYAQMITTYEKLKSILDTSAYAMSDNGAAESLNEAHTQLFQSVNNAQQPAA